jgi:hypothetical protein
MKQRCAAAVLVFLCADSLFAVDPAEGYWLGVDDKTGEVMAGWEVYQKGGFLLGEMLSARDITETVIAARVRDSYPGFPLSGKVSAMPVLGTPGFLACGGKTPDAGLTVLSSTLMTETFTSARLRIIRLTVKSFPLKHWNCAGRLSFLAAASIGAEPRWRKPRVCGSNFGTA